jgi:hypothetical protein
VTRHGGHFRGLHSRQRIASVREVRHSAAVSGRRVGLVSWERGRVSGGSSGCVPGFPMCAARSRCGRWWRLDCGFPLPGLSACATAPVPAAGLSLRSPRAGRDLFPPGRASIVPASPALPLVCARWENILPARQPDHRRAQPMVSRPGAPAVRHRCRDALPVRPAPRAGRRPERARVRLRLGSRTRRHPLYLAAHSDSPRPGRRRAPGHGAQPASVPLSSGPPPRPASSMTAPADPALVAAAWLHDIGYSPELVVTGFHQLDGAEACAAAL